jgi:phage terminase large subunit-like protein
VVACYKRWKADIIVAEANFGGAMVESTIKAVDPNVNVKLVSASRGKVVRAEPIAALYEEGKMGHAGTHVLLEEQLALFARSGYQGDRSPDRADAMIWAATELMLETQSTYTLRNVS